MGPTIHEDVSDLKVRQRTRLRCLRPLLGLDYQVTPVGLKNDYQRQTLLRTLWFRHPF